MPVDIIIQVAALEAADGDGVSLDTLEFGPFSPLSTSLRRQMSASIPGSVLYPLSEYIRAETTTPEPGRRTFTSVPISAPGATDADFARAWQRVEKFFIVV